MLILQLLMTLNLFASEAKVLVTEATIKLMPPVSANSVGMMKIKNQSPSDLALIKVDCNVAKKVEFHLMRKVNGYMTMRPVDKISIRKGETFHLDGSYHLMFLGLKNPLKLNDQHKLTLIFNDGTSQEVEAKVSP